jgi:DNA-binding transcriptional MocR family regulator
LYTIVTFQNPTGRRYTAERDAPPASRRAGTPLFEDDPYRDLAYDTCERTPVCARLQRTSWIYQGSFSKSLAPGLRLGFLAASPDLFTQLVRLKQAADLHSSRIGQWLVLRELDDPGREARLASLVRFYRARRDAFATELARIVPRRSSLSVAPGRRVVLPCAISTPGVARARARGGVAFMRGEPFFSTSGAGARHRG